MIDIKVNLPSEGPIPRGLETRARDAGTAEAVTQLQQHFLARDEGPKKRPSDWPKRGWWAGLTQQVGSTTEGMKGSVTVTNPAFWRRYQGGGPITPKRGKYLALPAIAAAYAAGSPREGGAPNNLAFVFASHPQGGWRPALAVQEDVFKEVGRVRKDGTRRKKMVHQVGTVWYWLARQTNPPADPNAVPDQAALEQAVTLAVYSALSRYVTGRSQLISGQEKLRLPKS